ncbi:ATP-binding protein, partial [Modestobacter caceresii]|uniref:ATP-binding protein n=1 Tax=Modestobacter caceresii TaxID=1522368 RepID=UPI001E3E7674
NRSRPHRPRWISYPTPSQATALNAAHLQRFPRINGWLLIPSEAGFLIGTVTWVGIERSPYANFTAKSDKALVDLPFPVRRLRLAPLGTLRWLDHDGMTEPELIRGIPSYPSVGESVLVPSADQLRAIAQTTSKHTHVSIGTSPLAGDVDVRIDPNRLFGRHLAVLGNTGSGKSCTVAGLIRWSLEAARQTLEESGSDKQPNARFIVLDLNGEYANCFSDVAGVRVFRPSPQGDERELTVPGWIWSSAEWAAITRASLQTQRPLLQQALRNLRNNIDPDASGRAMLATQLRGFLDLWTGYSNDPAQYTKFPQHKSVSSSLDSMISVFEQLAQSGMDDALRDLLDALSTVAKKHLPKYVQYETAYTYDEVSKVVAALKAVQSATGVVGQSTQVSEDAPVRFDINVMTEHMYALSQTGEFSTGSAHTSYLVARLRTMLTDTRMRRVICPDTEQSFPDWLADVIGNEDASDGQIAVIDLSLLASDVVHTVVAVLARVVMEALQHVRRLTGSDLPTVLVLEEAHNFVGSRASASDIPTTSDLCRETFERIAREGRKFGLGLVLSSQRPSELSSTVLSQCNSFLLHRLVNDRDQDLVGRLVPDALGDLLRELPALPSRQAILLGWATPVPTLVEVHELTPQQRPQSDDPAYWDTWTRQRDVDFTWDDVAEHWINPSGEQDQEGDGVGLS